MNSSNKMIRANLTTMKRALILLTILAVAATPVMAQQIEATPAQTQATTKHHAAAKHKKQHVKKKVAKHATRKHKMAV